MSHRVSIITILLMAMMVHASFGCCWHHRHAQADEGNQSLGRCKCDHPSPDPLNHAPNHRKQEDCDQSDCTFLLNLGTRWDISSAVTSSPAGNLALLTFGVMGVTPAAIIDRNDPAEICCELSQIWRL